MASIRFLTPASSILLFIWAFQVSPPQTRAAPLADLPLSFEENRGQAEASVRFVARANGYTAKLGPGGAVLSIHTPHTGGPRSQIKMSLVGSRSNSSPRASNRLAGLATYCLGPDPARWVKAIPTYATVTFPEVYPGIDWVFYGDQRQMEFDFVLLPGANPDQVVLQFEGATASLTPSGDLKLHTTAGDVVQAKPVVYQWDHGQRKPVAGNYVVFSDTRVGFRADGFDRTAPLIIDPTLLYSTFFGSTNPVFNAGEAIALDGAGNIYITGNTLIIPGGAVFVSKLNPAGNALLYSFALGGSMGQQAMGIAVDKDGNACVVGTTSSSDFPVKNAQQKQLQEATDYFLMKINPQGTDFVFSTFLGSVGGFGNAPSRGGVAVDAAGNVYVAGTTASAAFPASANAYQKTLRNDLHDSFLRSDAFAAKLSPTGTLLYSTYLGGNAVDTGNAIAVDATGFAYVTGSTLSVDYPTSPNAPYHGEGLSASEAFVTKLNQDGSALVYSTYIQGASESRSIALDAQGNAYITGFCGGPGLPTTASSFQPNPSGNGTHDAYLVKLDSTGNAVTYATYLGGDGDDEGMAVAATPDGYSAVTGYAGFTGTPFGFPTTNSLQAFAGNEDAFIAKFNPAGQILYSTYLGGSQADVGNGVTFDSTGNVLVIGQTESSDFPLTNALRSTYMQGQAFVAKLSDLTPTNSAPQTYRLFSSYGFGNGGSFNLNIFIPIAHDYELQASTNLLDWVNVTPFAVDLQGRFQYSDIFAPFYSERYYRVLAATNSGGGKR